MTTGAKNSFGNLFQMAPSGSTPVTIGEQTTWTPPSLTRGMQDATTLDQASQAMEFIPEGVYDPGEIEFTYQHIDQNTADTAVYTAMATGALQDINVIFKKASGTGNWGGKGYVTSYKPGAVDPKGKQIITCTVKATGPWTKS